MRMPSSKTSPQRSVGIDFGTTNSAIAVADAGGAVTLARFPINDRETETFRSVLYFEQHKEGLRKTIASSAGPEAIMRYLSAEQKGRLIQSLKSYLASRLLMSTNVYGRTYSLEDLLAFILRSLRQQAEAALGPLGTRAVVGRPVCFSGAESEKDEELAVTRLQDALSKAGFDQITFNYEPVGAAYHYESRLDHPEVIMVADFGGGTSDFSLMRVGPASGKKSHSRKILGTDGVAIAGDAFDAKIVRHVVSPLLGEGSTYRSMHKTLPVPAWIYSKLERWHHLSFLKSKETMHALHAILAESSAPEQIQTLIHLINDNLGFYLHQAVQRVKAELSEREATVFQFQVPGISISQLVSRKHFENWIEPELHEFSACIDRLLRKVGVEAKDVDRVFLTGGSSFVPSVRALFANQFGNERLVFGDEFTSVARGLSLSALQPIVQ
jgi:hypothetical chaperone protein